MKSIAHMWAEGGVGGGGDCEKGVRHVSGNATQSERASANTLNWNPIKVAVEGKKR